jgi:hypothetical protein
MYRKEQMAIEKFLDKQRLQDPEYLMPESMRERLAEIDQFMARTTSGALNVQKALDAAQAAVPTEVLEQQLKHELALAAVSFTAEDWRMAVARFTAVNWALLDAVRAEQQKGATA